MTTEILDTSYTDYNTGTNSLYYCSPYILVLRELYHYVVLER